MDAVIFISVALFLTLKIMYGKEAETPTQKAIDKMVVEDVTRTAKLNESFYEDPNAFSEIINALGYPKE